jgi:hypothetical protein
MVFQANPNYGVVNMLTNDLYINYQLLLWAKATGRFFLMVDLSEPNVDFSEIGSKSRDIFNCTVALVRIEENNSAFRNVTDKIKNGIVFLHQLGIGKTKTYESLLMKTIILSGK